MENRTDNRTDGSTAGSTGSTGRTESTAGSVPRWAGEAGLPEGEVGLLTRIVRLNMLVTGVLDGLVAPHGITVADYLVLSTVRRADGGRSAPTTLCRLLGRTTGGMSLTLDRLTAAGWVRRLPDPADRRRVIVELTPAGLATAEKVNGALHAWERGLALAPSDQARHERQLDALIALVEAPRAE